MINKKIKITHIARFASPHKGGIESFIEMFNSCIKSEKVNIEVFCCSKKDKSSVENGIKYNRCNYLFDFAANSISPQLFFRIMFLKTDIIIFHMPVIQNVIIWFILYHLGLLRYKKMVICYHSDIIGYDKFMKPFWGLYNYFLSKADIIHVQSPQMLENSMVSNFKDRGLIIPYLIDATCKHNKNNVSQIKQEYGNKKIIFSLGRHVQYKGFEYLISAMKNVQNAVLLLGGSGYLTNEYNELIETHNLKEKVFLLGKVPQEKLEDYYESCDLFVLPSISKSETFAVVQLEAMKHSKPVINTNLGTGVNYVSIDKETGLTVEPKNVEQLTNAINELLNNDELRLRYGQNARKRVEDIFNLKEIREQYTCLYEGDGNE